MAMEGMDTGLATSQATQLQNQGIEAVQNVISQVGNLVNAIEANWKGPDATNFQSEWSGQLLPQLNNVMQSLTTFHTTFNNNINQQISASSN